MTIEEIKDALLGEELFVGGEWNSEGIIGNVKLVEFEGEECVFIYEKEKPNELWCWFPRKDIETLFLGGSVYGGQIDAANIQFKDW